MPMTARRRGWRTSKGGGEYWSAERATLAAVVVEEVATAGVSILGEVVLATKSVARMVKVFILKIECFKVA